MTSMLPGMSTIFAITQAKMETAKVVATATEFFDPEESIEDPCIDDSISDEAKEEEQIKILINLMTLDSRATQEEIKFITPIIKNSSITRIKKQEYLGALKDSATDYVVDYELLKKIR